MNYDKLREIDLRHLWHPFSDFSALESADFPIISRAAGICLFDVRGRVILDGISSWWCVNLGHSHPMLVEAIRSQGSMLQHSILGGMSHPGAIALAQRLAEVTPEGLNRVFFASDGASAVEAAMRMAIEYWYHHGQAEKKNFISLRDAYHGDTLKAVSLGFVEHYHHPVAHVVEQAWRADSPHCFHCPHRRDDNSCKIECFESMRKLVETHANEVAAVVIEPICQAAAGMRIYKPEYLQQLRALCDEHDLLLIADEIAVGFGRSGLLFACDHAGISPDIMCLGKGLTGGYLPMSAAVTTDRVADTFRSKGGETRMFCHGHTFCGNPIAAATALAVLETYEQDDILSGAEATMGILAEGFANFAKRNEVANAATLGMMSSMEISESAGGAKAARQIADNALERGLFIRPLGNILYLWPAMITTPQEMKQMLSILDDAMDSKVDH
ncbi:MAG TPA: adenosylmethionine--8-amino-7-oxononanoate transaminase [Phycisphaerae bacterium]|nr:adenosylmethionine--8-amino-7-oxononanoate transaminase [Phycisphaerae bacterium]